MVNYVYAYNMSMGNSKFNVLDASTLFFPYLLKAQNMVQVIESGIIRNGLRRKKLLRVSGRFESLRVQVTEGNCSFIKMYTCSK